MTTRVFGGNIITPSGVQESGVLVVEDGVIAAIEEPGRYAVTDATPPGGFVAPGFIDMHMHGIGGADTMDASSESLEKMARSLKSHGVTGFLATTVTHSLEQTIEAVQEVAQYMENQHSHQGAGILGLHLEGPWISKAAKGAQNEDFVIPPRMEDVESVLKAARGTVRKVSIAPEVTGAMEVIRSLCESGIHVSIAHTTATFEQTMEAFQAGAAHVTHCFNAMTGLHHRHPGVVGAALLAEEVYAELIADGMHVHPAAMKLLVNNKGRDRVMLISDSIMAADMPDGTYSLGGLTVQVSDGRATLADGTLAGSTLTLDRAVRNMVQLVGVTLVDAVYMAATTPAKAIGFGDRKGKLAVGYDADLVLLNDQLYPVLTVVSGEN